MESFKKVGVLGAGTMGSAIAQHFAMKGLEVTLVDLSATNLERAFKLIGNTLLEAQQRKIVTAEDVQKTLGRIKMTTQQQDLHQCEFLVEAVFEDLEIKRKVLAELENHVPGDCVLASNTSSFLISEIAQNMKHPERLVGVHYFYHAAKNKLVEIIPGPKTSPALCQKLMNFYSQCDKTPILVRDAPGFAVNRYFVPWLNEAARLLEEGFGSISFIDETARELFHVGLGPFALMNATGVPIALHAADGLETKLGSFYRGAESLRNQVAFKKDWDLTESLPRNGGKDNRTVVRERLIAATLGVAGQMVAEGVVDAAAADLGARVGLRWVKGPFELARELGLVETQGVVDKYFKQWRLNVPSLSSRLNWIESRIDGKNGFLIFNIPDRMNALSEDVMTDFYESWLALEKNSKVETVFITGKGKAFVAGADIKFFTDCLDKKDIDRIQKFTAFGQMVLSKIENSQKRSVAYLNGLTLGGGLELALACHYRVAGTKALLGFPETGIGIYPGLGGTQRTSRLIGLGLAKFLVATGQLLDAATALKYGLVDQMTSPIFDLNELGKLSFAHRKPLSQNEASQVSFQENAFAEYDGTLSPEYFQKDIFKKYEKALSRKAPAALRLAMSLMDRGNKVELAKGLTFELDHLKEVFTTKDARIGLESVLKKSKPEFTGI